MTTAEHPYATMARARDAFDLARKALYAAQHDYHEALDAYTRGCRETGGGEYPKCYFCDATSDMDTIWAQVCCGRLACLDCEGPLHNCEERTP